MKKTYHKPTTTVFCFTFNNMLQQYSVHEYNDGGTISVGDDEDEEESNNTNSLWSDL